MVHYYGIIQIRRVKMTYRLKLPELHLEADCIKALTTCTSSAFYDFSTLCMDPTSSAHLLIH
jgi:hypothetical protein